MAEREQIGPNGLGFLLFGFLMGSSLLLPMGAQAKEAAWIATLLGGTASLGLAWIYARLARAYPGESLVGCTQRILGRWLGGLVTLLYIWFGLHLASLVLRNFGEFLVTSLLPTTPISVLIIVLMLLCVYAVRHGLEPLARTAQILTVTVIALVSVTAFMLTPEAEGQNLLPVMGGGLPSILRAAVTVMAFPFGETVLFGMIFHRVRPKGSVFPTLSRSILAATLVLALVTLLGTAVLGAHIRGVSRYATLAVIRQVMIADFITNLDAVVIGAWVFTGFLKVSACLYITASSVAELIGSVDFRPLLLPLGVIAASLSMLVYEDSSQMAAFLAVWPIYSAPFQLFMPLLLLGASRFRRGSHSANS